MTFLPHKKKKKCPILVCVLVCVTHFVGLWDYTSRKKNMEGHTLVVFCLVIGCRLSVLMEMANVKGREEETKISTVDSMYPMTHSSKWDQDQTIWTQREEGEPKPLFPRALKKVVNEKGI